MNNRFSGVILLTLLIFIPLGSSAQYFLSLEKPGTLKRIRYYPGDDFWYETQYQEGRNKGTVTKVIQDTIFINGQAIPLSDITVVHKPRSNKGKAITGALAGNMFLAAVFIPVGALANMNQYNPTWKTWTLVGAGSLVLTGVGLLILKLHFTTYNLEKKWQLKTLYAPAIPPDWQR